MNVQGEIKGDKLILIVDVSKEAIAKASPSSTGKSLIVGTTSGYSGFGHVKASLNVTVPNK